MFALRRCLFACLITLACIASAQEAPKTITYTTVAVPVRTAVEELAKQTGLKLVVSKQIAEEPLILRLENVPPQEAMDRIAAAMSAEWEQDPEGIRLTRSPSLLRKLAKDRIARRMERFNKSVDRLVAAFRQAPDWTEEQALALAKKQHALQLSAERGDSGEHAAMGFLEIEEQTPSYRLFARLLPAMNLEPIAAQNGNSRLVFSSSPNRLQRALPQTALSAAELAMAEQDRWTMAMEEVRPSNEPIDFVREPQDRKPAKVLLTARTFDHNGIAGLEVAVYNATGEILYQSSTMLGADFGMWQRLEVADQKLEQDAKDEPSISLSALSQELLTKGLAGVVGTRAPKEEPPSKELMGILLAPDTVDPLSLAASEMLLQTAEAKGLQLVAYLDDAMAAVPIYFTKKETIKPSVVLARTTSLGRTEVEVADGWMIARPQEPLTALETRTSRKALARVLNAAHKKGYVTLEDLATFALSRSEGGEGTLFRLYVQTILGQDQSLPGNEWELLRLYGSLYDHQRQALTSGQPLRAGDLSPDQFAIFARIVYNLPLPMIPNEEDLGSDGRPDMLAFEPTESLSNGILPDSTIAVEVTGGQTLYTSLKFGDQNVGFQPMDDDQFAYMLIASKKNDPTYENPPQITGIRLGSTRMLTFNFQLAPNRTSSMHLNENHLHPGPVMQLETLPQAIRDRLAKRIAEIEKEMEPPPRLLK